MTKAKARARKKARMLAKMTNPKAGDAKPDAKDAKPETEQRRGKFDPNAGTMRNRAGANIKSIGGVRRGAARSR